MTTSIVHVRRILRVRRGVVFKHHVHFPLKICAVEYISLLLNYELALYKYKNMRAQSSTFLWI